MKKFRFLDWKVYKDAKELFKILLKIVKSLPKEYRFEIGSQLVRSGLSTIINIAEGCGKSSDKELNRYLDISSGSLFEVLSIVDVLHDNNLVDREIFTDVCEKVDEISNQLGGLKKKIKADLRD